MCAVIRDHRKGLSLTRWALLSVDAGLCVVVLFLFCCFMDRPVFDLEAWLSDTFPPAHADAFAHVNDLITVPLAAVPIVWLAAAAALTITRCYKQLFALGVGPLFAASLVAPFEDWSDPNWFIIGGVTIVGCFVGVIVSALWCLAAWLPNMKYVSCLLALPVFALLHAPAAPSAEPNHGGPPGFEDRRGGPRRESVVSRALRESLRALYEVPRPLQ